jgi:hypothetical protein
MNLSLVAMTGVSNRTSVLAWIVMCTFAGQRGIPWSGISDNGIQPFGSSIFKLTGLSFMSRDSFHIGNSKCGWDDVSLHSGGRSRGHDRFRSIVWKYRFAS